LIAQGRRTSTRSLATPRSRRCPTATDLWTPDAHAAEIQKLDRLVFGDASREKWCGNVAQRLRDTSEAETALQVLELIQDPEGGPTSAKWWTQSKPIRTLAQMHVTFSLLETRPSFVYQQVAENARELSRLGMSVRAIARTLRITDKTVIKALGYYHSGPKGTEPSA
jgi:hypothetical protein